MGGGDHPEQGGEGHHSGPGMARAAARSQGTVPYRSFAQKVLRLLAGSVQAAAVTASATTHCTAFTMRMTTPSGSQTLRDIGTSLAVIAPSHQ